VGQQLDDGREHEAAGQRTVRYLRAGANAAGEAVHEEVLVDELRDGSFRIAATPGMVEGIAAGDVIRLDNDDSFTVVHRGGNVAVHVYYRPVEEDVDDLRPEIESLGGWLDGADDRGVRAFTIPMDVGFPAIEAVLRSFLERHPKAEWGYGNVYDEEGRPLNWWEQA
jgi:hypothetical protein